MLICQMTAVICLTKCKRLREKSSFGFLNLDIILFDATYHCQQCWHIFMVVYKHRRQSSRCSCDKDSYKEKVGMCYYWLYKCWGRTDSILTNWWGDTNIKSQVSKYFIIINWTSASKCLFIHRNYNNHITINPPIFHSWDALNFTSKV